MHTDGQLRAAHLILGYTPISKAFQAPKCVIKAHDPRLPRISVAVEGFLLPEGTTIPQGTLVTQPIHPSQLVPVGIPTVPFSTKITPGEAASSHSTVKEEEEEIVEVADSEDEFEVFNQPYSPEDSTSILGTSTQISKAIIEELDDMGIQRKIKPSLKDVLEGADKGHKVQEPPKELRSRTQEKGADKGPEARLPPPPPSSQTQCTNAADLKRKRD